MKLKYETIIYEEQDGIGILTLNRPRVLNALSPQLASEAEEVLDEAASKAGIKVVIIAGSERAFSCGADVGGGVPKLVTPRRHEANVITFVEFVSQFEKPTIAAISGYCLGGGCELALACDLRVASLTAKFGLPEIKIGLLAGAGGTQRLPRLIGLTKAKELLYSGDSVDAQEAYRIGLVNKVVPLESLMEEAKKMARVLMERPPLALKLIKKCVDIGMQIDLSSGLQYERKCAELLFGSEDAKEGVSAFLEKRKPTFTGK